ncbi:hypothetical protein Trydic_g22102 [Trypoxylus dichotomus]
MALRSKPWTINKINRKCSNINCYLRKKVCFIFILYYVVMTVFHDEIEIEDFEYDEEEEIYHYPCPCGDRFEISKEDLLAGEEIATCPSCSLVIKVIYDLEAFQQESNEVKTVVEDFKKLKVTN